MEALRAFFERIKDDQRLGPMHISLYAALFDCWIGQSSPQYFRLDREELMKRSKILGKTSYYKCLKELATYGLIEYRPEHYPGKGSKVRMEGSRCF
jgi:hypothetical protein